MNRIIKSKAPLRINFAGGGTDCEPYVSDYGSHILSASIKLYTTAVFGDNYTPKFPIEQLLTEVGGKPLQLLSDVSGTSGLGGSGCCFVAGLTAIYPQLSKGQLAELSLYLERKVMQNVSGNQDQYCSAFGGLLFLTTEGNVTEVQQLIMPPELTQLLVLVYTTDRTVSGKEIIRDEMTTANTKHLHYQKQLAKEMKECLHNPKEFARLLREVWSAKKALSPKITRPEIDELCTEALTLGAAACCLMGAGNGGYMLLMADPNREGELRQGLVRKRVPYLNVELDTLGTRVLEGI